MTFLRKVVFACICAVFSVAASLPAEILIPPSFRQTMTVDGKIPSKHTKATTSWKIFEALYKKPGKSKSAKKQKLLIPKKIHMIWIGSEPPAFCLTMLESWKKFHPSWDVRLWKEDDIAAFGLTNQAAYDAAKNWAEKSDIARYEILYRLGGLYVDADFECLHSFRSLHSKCEFYAGLGLDGESPFLYNGLIGSAPKHPVMKACINLIRPGPGDHDAGRIQYETGPGLITRGLFAAASLGKKEKKNRKLFIKRLRKMKVFPLPMTMVYPLPHWARREVFDIEEVKREWVREESIAIHYWSVSWMKNLIPG